MSLLFDEDDVYTNSAPFKARFPGTCRVCFDEFDTGELIKLRDGQTVHELCTSTDINNLNFNPRTICPQCFMEMPTSGVCDNH